MNLTVDQGNSFTKIGIFEQDNLIYDSILQDNSNKEFTNLFKKYPIKNSIISSVIDCSPEIINILKQNSKNFIELNSETPIPIKNSYKTPSTLGKDRIAVAVAAHYLKPEVNKLVIDAGTTITYEFITNTGEYLGGNISPGMKMRFKALNHFTKKLPLLNFEENFRFFGNDTKTAINSGVINGISFEIDGYIDRLKEKYPDIFIFFTGGDTFFFENTLKNRTFVHKNLLLTGLNRILVYNV